MHVEVHLFLLDREIYLRFREYLLFEGNGINDKVEIDVVLEVLEETNIQAPGTLQCEVIEGNINFFDWRVECKQNKLLKVRNRGILDLIVGEI